MLVMPTMLLLLLLPTPAAQAAASKDPVIRAINKARTSKHITSATATKLRKEWTLSARAARTAKSASRRAAIRTVRSQTTSLARRGLLTPPRVEGAMLSVTATRYVMTRAKTYPRHMEHLTIPGEPLVFLYYSGRGVQLQPFETLKVGMQAINRVTKRTADPDVDRARAIADRLLQLGVRRGASLTFEYYFPFGGPHRPWTSSISQALATEFFWRTGMLLPESERQPYLDAAARVTESFLRSTRAGGVSANEAGGRFYVMYPFAPAQRILNGHLQVLINVNRYADWSGNPRARAVVQRGLTSAHALLPKFDTGGWSRYQLGQEANLNYHDFQAGQLVTLGKELKDPVLEEYGARFTTYRETPPVLMVEGTSWPAIIPARDGYRDEAKIAFQLDKRSRVTMVVRDQLMREVYRNSTWHGSGRHAVSWSGIDSRSRTVPDGGYLVSFTVTDIVGNRSTTQLPGLVRIARDVNPPVLKKITLRAKGTSTVVGVTAFDAGSGWVDVQIKEGNKVIASKRGRRSGTTTLTVPRRMAATRRAVLVLRDSSGNQLVTPVAG